MIFRPRLAPRYGGPLQRSRAKNLAALVLAGFLLAACANRPESIHASYVSHEKFMDLDCAALDTKMGDTRAELVKYSDMQNTKANEDAWGVFLLGIPVSKLSGDVEGEVARLKGEVEAIDTARIKKHCGTTVAGSHAPVAKAKGPVAMAAPIAARPASPRSSASGLLPAGTSWVYRFSDRIYTDNVASITVKVLRADGQIVEERLSASMSATRATAVRREVDARATSFDLYPLGAKEEVLTEFAPYLFAAGGERAVRAVADVTGYPRDGVQSWITDTAPPAWDLVTVPAGTFRAMRLDITGRRGATYPNTVKFVVRVWYAPDVNRYVKLEHKSWVHFGQIVTDETVELVRFNPPS